MAASPTTRALRRCVLAVSVIDDIDLSPGDRNVLVEGTPPVRVPWRLVRRAIGIAHPATELARQRLAGWLHGVRWAADLGAAELAGRARPYCLAVGHRLHPGPAWGRRGVLGDAGD